MIETAHLVPETIRRTGARTGAVFQLAVKVIREKQSITGVIWIPPPLPKSFIVRNLLAEADALLRVDSSVKWDFGQRIFPIWLSRFLRKICIFNSVSEIVVRHPTREFKFRASETDTKAKICSKSLSFRMPQIVCELEEFARKSFFGLRSLATPGQKGLNLVAGNARIFARILPSYFKGARAVAVSRAL